MLRAAWNEEEKPYLPKGPTGVAMRSLTKENQLKLGLLVRHI